MQKPKHGLRFVSPLKMKLGIHTLYFTDYRVMATTPSFILTTLQAHKHSEMWLHSVLQITIDLAPSGRWLMKIPA